MMRYLRPLFVVVLALALVAVALANREIVTVSLFPANFDRYLGERWSLDLPLFLVILLTFAFGMLAGLIWEWLREAHIRREASARRAEVARLQGEMGQLRSRHAAPEDDVLAILDAPETKPASATDVPPAPQLPVTR
ncbi:MAG: LapA family protein [Paracoccus sp. (in: a-proteobacteria)]|nr:LapA family protein [Paracoccus sp. (in: a-proteobacteria)]